MEALAVRESLDKEDADKLSKDPTTYNALWDKMQGRIYQVIVDDMAEVYRGE